MVHHRGRRSGRAYSTPVNLFPLGDDEAVVALTYGPVADWARNVLDGGGDVESVTGVRPITASSVVDRSVAWPVLPWFVRAALRVLRVRDFMRLSLGPA